MVLGRQDEDRKSLGEVQGRMVGIEREINETRRMLVSAEVKLTKSLDRLVDRLDRSHDEMAATLKGITEGLGERLRTVEEQSGNTRFLARLAITCIPLIGMVSVWLKSNALDFTRPETLLLKEQAQDLLRHRESGGNGANWIMPERRVRPVD